MKNIQLNLTASEIDVLDTALHIVQTEKLLSNKHENGDELNVGLLASLDELVDKIDRLAKKEHQAQIAEDYKKEAEQHAMLEFCSEGVC